MATSAATGLVLLVVVLVAWVAVQQAWRKVFPETGADPDPLAGRTGCLGTCNREVCPKRRSEPEAAGEEDDS